MKPTILSILGAIVIVFVMKRILAWLANRMADRAVDRALHSEKHPDKNPTKLDPESRFIVRITDSEVSCERPDGLIERVTWADLQAVEILNTDDGPWAPDAFWVLRAHESGCVIPWGATGDSELLKRLQQLPGFDNRAVINSSSSPDNQRAVCWQRS